MLIRVRTPVALWRIENLKGEDTLYEVRSRLVTEHHIKSHSGQFFFMDPKTKDQPLDENQTLASFKARDGWLVHFHMEKDDVAHETSKKISADGTIVNQEVEEISEKTGFRPGMRSLRSMKKHWTLSEFVELDSQFEYKIKRQKFAMCHRISFNKIAGDNIGAYVDGTLNFEQCRIIYLYGRYVQLGENNEALTEEEVKLQEEEEAKLAKEEEERKKNAPWKPPADPLVEIERSKFGVEVEVTYEPLQDGGIEKSELLDDEERLNKVEAIAGFLGLQKVGIMFVHPTREDAFILSDEEVLLSAEGQLLDADGIEPPTAFATVELKRNIDGHVQAEGWQVSKQCMQMLADGALVPNVNGKPGYCSVPNTFTAIVAGQPASEVHNLYFMNRVPVKFHESSIFVEEFPHFNRLDSTPSQNALKARIEKAGTKGWTFIDILSDFHLLIFLADSFTMDDMKNICTSVIDRKVELQNGYVDLIRAIAGCYG